MTELKLNVLGFEAGNLHSIVVVDIGVDRVFTLDRPISLRCCKYPYVSVTYRWDLLGQLDLLLQDHVTLLQRAVEVNILDLLAEIGGLSDERDQTILDFQENGSTLLDSFAQGTRSLNGKSLTTIYRY